MSKPPKSRALLWLVMIFLILGLGHYMLFRFAFDELNPYPLTRGMVFGSTLFSSVLILAMAARRAWARYVLGAWLACALLIFGLVVLMMNKQSVKLLSTSTEQAAVGLGAYLLALAPLGFSRSLRHYLAPRTAGGR